MLTDSSRTLDDIAKHLSLSSNVNIQTLRLSHGLLVQKEPDWLTALLNDVKSTTLGTLKLGFRVPQDNAKFHDGTRFIEEDAKVDIDNFAWNALDRRVSELADFRSLTVIVNLCTDDDEPVSDAGLVAAIGLWTLSVQQKLPLTDKRGMLEVIVQEADGGFLGEGEEFN